MDRRTRDRSRWTGWVGGKSVLQEPNNRFERVTLRVQIDHIKRLVKHFAPMRRVHAAAAHFLQQLYARIVQNKNVFFLRHVN
jgi:hypothetical protein